MNESVHSTELKRTLGTWSVVTLGVGAVVGFGWVVLVGDWILNAGSLGAALAFVVGGLMMALIALIYSEMVAAMPKAGGEHNYIIRGLGPRWSLVGSWAIVGGYATVVAFEAVALPRALNFVLPLEKIYLWQVAEFDVYLVWVLVGVIAAIAITVINILGIRVASGVQTFVVLFLFVVAALQIAGIFMNGDPANFDPLFTGGTAGFFAVLVVVPFMFVGFDVIPQTAEEVNLPPKKIGQISVISVLIATGWYVIIVAAAAVALSEDALGVSSLPAVDAFKALWNGSNFMANMMVAAGVAGILTSWNSLQMGASRLLFSLARGGMLPAWIGKIHPKFGTPVNALLLLGACAVAAPFFGRQALVWIVDAGSPMIVLAYMLVCISFVMLRKREPDMERPLRIGGKGNFGIVLGTLGIVVTVFLFALYMPGMPATISPQSWIIFGLWWAFGVYFLIRVPGGIKPGPTAEHQVIAAVTARNKVVLPKE